MNFINMCTLVERNSKTQENGICQIIFEMSTRILKHFLKCSFIQFHVIFDILIDLIFGLYYKNDIQKVPPIKNNLILMSASELAEKIRTKKNIIIRSCNGIYRKSKGSK